MNRRTLLWVVGGLALAFVVLVVGVAVDGVIRAESSFS